MTGINRVILILQKLYFDIWHKSTLPFISVLLILLYPNNYLYYQFAKVLSIYSIALIFADFGINQILYKKFAIYYEDSDMHKIIEIISLYANKIIINFIISIILGGYFIINDIFEPRIILSFSIWLLSSQLSAQPALSASRSFSKLSITALISQITTFIVVYNIYQGDRTGGCSLTYLPSILSSSVFIWSWLIVASKSNVTLIIFNKLLKLFKNNLNYISQQWISNFRNSFNELGYVWINTTLTVILYQMPILLLSNLSIQNLQDSSSNSSLASNLLVLVKLNSIFITIFQYLSQYKISEYSTRKFGQKLDTIQHIKIDINRINRSLSRLLTIIVVLLMTAISLFYILNSDSPFDILSYFLMLITMISIFFRSNRILINKIIISLSLYFKPIYYFNAISICISLFIYIYISTESLIQTNTKPIIIVLIGLACDASLYIHFNNFIRRSCKSQ